MKQEDRTFLRKVGTVVAASVAVLAAKRFLNSSKLERKYEKKRQTCQETFDRVQQQLNQVQLSPADKDSILSLSFSELQSELQNGKLNAVDVLAAYQTKALEVNAKINCVVEAVTYAQTDASACDSQGSKTRVLHGIPVSLKENIAIKGYDTTAGMEVNIDQPWTEDAVIVQVLKRHGAIPFMRTNVPQAMLSYTCTNPIYGTTVNPHNFAHCPGGSTGGEGAILGGAASIAGFGTDVGGSVRVPAAFCGVCAFKPSLGRFSKQGVYSVYKGQTIIAGVTGPMGRDVNTLVVMTRVMASPDMFDLDPSLPCLPFQEEELSSTRRLKIGYFTWDGNLRPVPAVCRAVREAVRALERLGHTVTEFNPPDFADGYPQLYIGSIVGADQGETLKALVKNDRLEIGLQVLRLTSLPRWILSLLAKLISLKEPILGKSLLHIKKEGRTYNWFRQVAKIMEYRTKFMQRWKSSGLDAVICPAFACPAPKNTDVGYLTAAGSSSALFNLVNFPAGVVPVTKVTAQDVDDVNNRKLYNADTKLTQRLKNSCSSAESVGLPLGVQCATLPFKEELCLRVMGELEAALNYNAV